MLLWTSVCTAVHTVTCQVFEAEYIIMSLAGWLQFINTTFDPVQLAKSRICLQWEPQVPKSMTIDVSQVNDWHLTQHQIKELRKNPGSCQHCSDGFLQNWHWHWVADLMAFGRFGSPSLLPWNVTGFEALQSSHLCRCHTSVFLRKAKAGHWFCFWAIEKDSNGKCPTTKIHVIVSLQRKSYKKVTWLCWETKLNVNTVDN